MEHELNQGPQGAIAVLLIMLAFVAYFSLSIMVSKSDPLYSLTSQCSMKIQIRRLCQVFFWLNTAGGVNSCGFEINCKSVKSNKFMFLVRERSATCFWT